MQPHTLRRFQTGSGLVFSLFLVVHLVNVALATFGAETHDAYQRAVRAAYQHPLLEPWLVLLPLVVHIACGVVTTKRHLSSTAQRPRDLRTRAHRWSGRFLLLVIIGHVVATRGASLLSDTWPEFAGIAFTFVWVPAYFFPYYTLFAVAAVVHGVLGLALGLPTFGLRVSTLLAPRVLVPVLLVLSVVVVTGVLGYSGLLFDVGDPSESPYARLVLSLTGS